MTVAWKDDWLDIKWLNISSQLSILFDDFTHVAVLCMIQLYQVTAIGLAFQNDLHRLPFLCPTSLKYIHSSEHLRKEMCKRRCITDKCKKLTLCFNNPSNKSQKEIGISAWIREQCSKQVKQQILQLNYKLILFHEQIIT